MDKMKVSRRNAIKKTAAGLTSLMIPPQFLRAAEAVKPFGEDNSDHPDSFYAKSSFKRFIVLVSGVVINAILPLFLFFFTYLLDFY